MTLKLVASITMERNETNKPTVYLYLVTGFSDSSSNTSYDSDEVVHGNWKRRKRMDGNEVKPKKVRYFF